MLSVIKYAVIKAVNQCMMHATQLSLHSKNTLNFISPELWPSKPEMN